MKQIILLLVFLYRLFISPVFILFFGHACRFKPSCSEYMRLAVSHYGAVKGFWMGLGRLLRCHPFAKDFQHDPLVLPSGQNEDEAVGSTPDTHK